MTHPVLVEVTRGGMVESQHTGSYVVVDGKGRVVASAGDIDDAGLPALGDQGLAMPAGDRERRCRSLSASAMRRSRSSAHRIMASRAMSRRRAACWRRPALAEEAYECGAHWPLETQALHAMIRAGREAGPGSQ